MRKNIFGCFLKTLITLIFFLQFKVKDIKILTEDLPILSFNEDAASQAAEIYHYLRHKNKMIEFRDIFIAATCIVNNLPVKTLNKKHFDRIPGLIISN